MSASFEIQPVEKLSGELTVPGDKSISHRAAILSGLSRGSCRIENFLSSEDCVNTLRAMLQLGASCEVLRGTEDAPLDLIIHGRGGDLQAPKKAIDCGNSGTGMRLLAGVLAAQNFDSELIGDDSLSGRPMGRITTPLERMGARILSKGSQAGCAPLAITGGALKPIEYTLPMASAQVKSAVLLAGLFAPGKTVVHQPAVTRDHTERLFEAYGIHCEVNGNTISLEGLQNIQPIDLVVPGDVSSAAFWIVAAACRPGAILTIRNVGLNPTRTAVLDVVERMGARIERKNVVEAGEPYGDLVIHGSTLDGTSILPEEVPNLIDEVPILAIAGVLARGRMSIRNAHELRVKETDRIDTVVRNLRTLGVEVDEFEDGLEIPGGQSFSGGTVQSFGDHRIAMAFAIAGLFAKEPVRVEDVDCVQTSYPSFADHLRQFQG